MSFGIKCFINYVMYKDISHIKCLNGLLNLKGSIKHCHFEKLTALELKNPGLKVID